MTNETTLGRQWGDNGRIPGTVTSQYQPARLTGSLQPCNRYVILTFLSGPEVLKYRRLIGFECIWYPTSFELDVVLLRELSAKGYGYKRIAGEYAKATGEYISHTTVRERLADA